MARGSSAPATTARSSRSIATASGSVFYDSTEMEVHALAPAPNGGLYVGTSPDGRIYRVDATGQATTFFDPDDKYIWSLDRRSRRQRVCRHRRQGHRLQDHARRQRHEVLRVKDRARRFARVRSEPAAAGRHRRAGPRVPRRRVGQGLPAARHDVPGNSRHSRRSEGRHLRGRAKRPRTGRRLAARDSRSCRRR